MALLTRAALAAASEQVPTVDVECPELGGTVRLRVLTASELAGVMVGARTAPDTSSLLFAVVSASAIDGETGDALWPSPDDVRKLPGKRSLDAIQRLFGEAMRLSNMTEDAEKN